MISVNSQMDVNSRRLERFVAKQGFNGHKIDTVFIQMSTKCMTERMAGNPFGPAEFLLVFVDVSGKIKVNDRTRVPFCQSQFMP